MTDEDLMLDRITVRLAEIAESCASAGWLDGRGAPYDRGKTLAAASTIFEYVKKYGLIKPYIYPTIRGDLSIEFQAPHSDLDMLLNLDTLVFGY